MQYKWVFIFKHNICIKMIYQVVLGSRLLTQLLYTYYVTSF